MASESALFGLAVEVLQAWQQDDKKWLLSEKASSLLRQRNQFVIGNDALDQSPWFWTGKDIHRFVREWQGDFVDSQAWFRRIDQESLFAYIIFAEEHFSISNKRLAILAFLLEDRFWRFHDAVTAYSEITETWSRSSKDANVRFSRESDDNARWQIQQDSDQDYWQLYDFDELPLDPNEGRDDLSTSTVSSQSGWGAARSPWGTEGQQSIQDPFLLYGIGRNSSIQHTTTQHQTSPSSSYPDHESIESTDLSQQPNLEPILSKAPKESIVNQQLNQPAQDSRNGTSNKNYSCTHDKNRSNSDVETNGNKDFKADESVHTTVVQAQASSLEMNTNLQQQDHTLAVTSNLAVSSADTVVTPTQTLTSSLISLTPSSPAVGSSFGSKPSTQEQVSHWGGLERQLERTLDNALALAEVAKLPPDRIRMVLERLLQRYQD